MRIATFFAVAAATTTLIAAAPAPVPGSAHQIVMTTIDGRPMPLAQYRGRVLVVVNTASFCGYTPQYEGLQKLHASYGKRGVTVVGVPSGDFGGQEFDEAGKIKAFCETKFGINFPLAEKSSVIGPAAAPFYRWAQSQLGEAAVPKWNFHKIVVGRDGRAVAAFGSKVTPQSPQMIAAIDGALAAK